MKPMNQMIGILRAGIFVLLTTGCASMQIDRPVAQVFEESRQIRYESRVGTDIWQTPKETAARKAGNCVDKAIYLNDLLQQQGFDARLAFGIVRRPSGNAGHAWVVLDNEIILDPTDGWITQTNNWVYLEYRFPVNEFNESYLETRIAQGD